MGLSGKQKKIIKKNIKKYSADNISNKYNINREDIFKYLRKIWSKDKYDSYLKKDVKNLTITNKNIFISSFIKNNYIYFFLLIILVFVTYANSLGNSFVSDDIAGILKNPRSADYSRMIDEYYEAFRVFIRITLYRIVGPTPWVYRLQFITLHSLTVVVLYYLFLVLYNKRAALFISTLFAVHPILTEAVIWISGGSYVRAAFFMLLSFLLYVLYNKNKESWYYYLSILSYILALFSLSKVILFMFVFIFYEIHRNRLIKNIKKISPYIISSIVYGFILIKPLFTRVEGLEQSYQIKSGIDNPFVQIPISISGYLELLFWPKNLSLYQTEITMMGDFEFWVRVVITIAFFGLIVYSFYRLKYVFFWLMFMMISLSIFLLPFRISWYVAERYIYLASIGFFAVIAYFLNKIVSRYEKYKYFIIVIFSIVILALSIRTIVRNRDWKDEDTLWFATYKTSPSGYQIHNNLGDVYSRRNDYYKAIEYFSKATKIKPDYAAAYHNLGVSYMKINDMNSAKENFHNALKYNPNIWQSNYNLGAIYHDMGDFGSAKIYFERAYSLKPDLTIYLNLGIVDLKLGNLLEARKIFNDILIQYPDNEMARNGLNEISKIENMVK